MTKTRALLLAVVLVFSLAPGATALEPGPNDGLSVEEYESRIAGWCDGLVANYGWAWDRDGSVTGWPGGCWRDDSRPSWEQCLAMGYEWDCPIPREPEPQAAPVPEPTPEPAPEPAPEPTPEPEVLTETAEPVRVQNDFVDPCASDACAR